MLMLSDKPPPVFVVMITTPFDACEPYTAAALASFKRSILAISDELIEVSVPLYINPSTTINGEVVPEMEFLPLTVMVGSVPAAVVWPIVRPGTVPLKDDITFGLGAC